jgi:hypothetical protein
MGSLSPPAPPAPRVEEGRLIVAADAQPQRRAEGSRPFEAVGWLGLVPTDQWHRCYACGATFATREGLRGHLRFGRCPAPGDRLDEPSLPETVLRRRVRGRLQELACGRAP